jgi:hypothetical protein
MGTLETMFAVAPHAAAVLTYGEVSPPNCGNTDAHRSNEAAIPRAATATITGGDMPTSTYDTPLIRWHAEVHYRTDNGPLLVEHDFEELMELHDRIELGPHWDTIEKIEVFRVNHNTATDLTVEQSKRLRQ